MKVTIAIPNFNGQDLLQQNLPSILESGADEVLVIDDGSADQSVQILKTDFPQVKLLVNEQNLGFIPSVNRLFDQAVGEIVVLLNSDVAVEKDFLPPIKKHFNKPQIFAVNCHEKGEGWSKLVWQEGFIQFERGQESSQVQKSAWASGGSAAFRKDLWIKLGGFDNLYAPFYWEDIDICFRALKLGFEILWEPKAKVYHEHQTTIAKTFSSKYVLDIQQRNQLLFIWKNISDPVLLKDHQNHLVKRLLGGMGLGYWKPFIQALVRKSQIKKTLEKVNRSDQEVINYAQN